MKIIDMNAHPPFGCADVVFKGKVTTEDFFSRITELEISAVCGTPLTSADFLRSHDPDEATELINDFARKLEVFEERYTAAITIHPDFPEFSVSQIEKYSKLGMKTSEFSAKHLSNKITHNILECFEKSGVFLRLYDATYEDVKNISANFPELVFSVSSLSPAELCELSLSNPNMYIDMSNVYWQFNYVLHEWSKKINPSRFLFATGYPNSNPAYKIASANWELRDSSTLMIQQIFYKNALALLGKQE